MDEARLHATIAAIYERALSAGRLGEVGGLIEEALGIGSSIHFVSEQAGGRMERLLSASANFDAAARRDYGAHYHDRNVWFQRARPRPPPVVVRGEELIDEAALLRSEFGADWCPRVGIFHMMGCTYPLPGGLIGGSGVHRTRRQGPFDDAAMRLYGLLMRHFANAVGLALRLERPAGRIGGAPAGATAGAAEDLLEALEIGALLLAGDRRLVHANPPAEAVLRQGRWLTCVDGRLRSVHHGSLGMLAMRIGAAARTAEGAGTDPGAVLRLQGRDARGALSALTLLILPFRGAPEGVGGGAGARATPRVLVLFRAPAPAAARPGPTPEAIAATYGLSPAEARLVALLVAGNTLTGAAGRAGISPNTAKTQLRSIFERIGVSRQADLLGELRGNPLLQLVPPRSAGR